ncbi:MAG TPA: iron-containing alcohol dehydrogenase [Pseudomonadales bacterium]|nr:iron-containing alcohol dehydrogenase [Pseudomonadales bacterium]
MSFILKILFRIFHFGMYIGALILPFPIPKVIKGPGSVTQLPKEIRARGVRHVLIVTGNNVRKMPSFAKMTDALEQKGIRYTVFSNLQPNPTIENVENARQAYLDAGCDGIIAFGGGSPMDCAKAAAARIVRNTSVRKLAGLFRVLVKIPPLFAVPTTAGSGSEVTIVAVITDPERQVKLSLIDPRLVPLVAVLDPELTAGLPPAITGATGMDALTHAVEAYLAVSANARTNQYAERAVELIFKYLEKAYQNGADMEAREQMALASHYAGIAFTKASVGYVHAISHKLGALYQVPHGLANAIVLPHVLESVGAKAQKKLARLAVIGGLGLPSESDSALAARFIDKVKTMNQAMDIPPYVEELKASDIAAVAASAAREANPMYSVPCILFRPQLSDLIARLIKSA